MITERKICMKKKSWIMIGAVIIIVLVLLAIAFAVTRGRGGADKEPVTLSLETFRHNGEYQYGEIAWKLPQSEVSKIWQYTWEKDDSREPLPADITYYKSSNAFLLDGQAATATFEFQNDELQIIQFAFHLDDKYIEWFEKQAEKLIQLYGAESERMENTSELFNSIGYKWETDTTTLQLILMTKEGSKPNALLGVGLK